MATIISPRNQFFLSVSVWEQEIISRITDVILHDELQTPLRNIALLYVRLYRNVDQVVSKKEVRRDNIRFLPPFFLELDSEISIDRIGHLPKSAGQIKENVQWERRQFRHYRPQRILTIPGSLRSQNHFVQVLEQTLHGLLIAPHLCQGRPQPIVF